jgi:hypothetical protein
MAARVRRCCGERGERARQREERAREKSVPEREGESESEQQEGVLVWAGRIGKILSKLVGFMVWHDLGEAFS